jgi:hypothetical protein
MEMCVPNLANVQSWCSGARNRAIANERECDYPFFLLMATKETLLVTAAITIALGLIHPMMFGPEGSFFAELFDTRVRFSGVSVGKQIGTVLGGGCATHRDQPACLEQRLNSAGRSLFRHFGSVCVCRCRDSA